MRPGITRGQLMLGYGACLASAAGYGAGAVLARKIVSDFAPPMVATAISLLVGTIMLTAISHRHVAGDLTRAPKRAWVMVALAGLAAAWGVSSFFLAVNHAPVVLVAPVSSVYPLFAILLAHLFLNRTERVTWQTVLGALLVVGGVAAITVGGE